MRNGLNVYHALNHIMVRILIALLGNNENPNLHLQKTTFLICLAYFFSIAVKCNDNELVLKTLAALGTGFDCASKVTSLNS